MYSRIGLALALAASTLAIPARGRALDPTLVLDGAQLIDGTGAPPILTARIVVSDGRITAIGPLASTPAPDGAEHVDLSGRTIVPGLIDLHFHIENDPKLALRQLSHGVTAFRDPGQWDDKFVPLREMVAADGLKGPHIFTCGPHIDGDHPAYPNDAVGLHFSEPNECLLPAYFHECHDTRGIPGCEPAPPKSAGPSDR